VRLSAICALCLWALVLVWASCGCQLTFLRMVQLFTRVSYLAKCALSVVQVGLSAPGTRFVEVRGHVSAHPEVHFSKPGQLWHVR
jgi:hypothetical protein